MGKTDIIDTRCRTVKEKRTYEAIQSKRGHKKKKKKKEAVKAVETKKMKVAVIGVMRRPREDNSYEDVRKQTNNKILWATHLCNLVT